VRIEAIDPASYDDDLAGLAALLVDAVDGGLDTAGVPEPATYYYKDLR
jgi:hypothetical protein